MISPHGRSELLNVRKPGCVRHIYWTYIIGEKEGGKAGRGHLFRDVILRMYWDEETDPSVECPLARALRGLKGDIRRRREELEALDGERAAIKEEVKIARNKLIKLMCYSKIGKERSCDTSS